MRAIRASSETMEYAAQYLNIVAAGIPFLIVSNSFSNIICAEGDAKTAMMGMIINNIMVNYGDMAAMLFTVTYRTHLKKMQHLQGAAL